MSRLQEPESGLEGSRPALVRLPGCYPVQADTWLLADTMTELGCAVGARVLDLCTGTGALAVAAALAGATDVTAVDLSYRSSANAWINARRHGVPVTVLRGDLFAALDEVGQFDLILANPPYVPSFTSRPSRHRVDRCWDAGPDGRLLLDRICREAYAHVAPGGSLLIVQSDVADVDATTRCLVQYGFGVEVVRREPEAFGPVMRARAAAMRRRGLVAEGQELEELAVVRAVRPTVGTVGLEATA
ncbi:methyltransferase [Knoellia flava TL1]|uniref:Methyltransferase n=2 Tax=Knoellia flava TaxID=913969 RepID=A0A8H9KSH2_9MICO|nr:HemK2/MTQ2 family protein methyltransferase [Knoellia flava]KGN35828.1 methyltransferase [Knoellia flava TL1]GGB80387.1 methyltransferase [Knoellia flava]